MGRVLGGGRGLAFVLVMETVILGHLWNLDKTYSKGLEVAVCFFIKYLLLLIIFDHYKEYTLIKETPGG